jgi:hypothetical protein
MTCLRVDLDATAGSVRVYNDGAGVPVEMHAVEKVYVPELIFGHLLTSSNYDDTEKKARRCGLGAVCAPARWRAPAPLHRCVAAWPCALTRFAALRCHVTDGGRPQRLRRETGQHLLH